MEETVIKEIANQLGMAVDQTGQFITAYLPQYAALKTWSDIFVLSMMLLVTVAFGVASAKLYKHYLALKEDGKWNDFDEYAQIAGIASGFCAVVFVIVSMFLVPEIIGWACFPEAQLIREAMSAIGA